MELMDKASGTLGKLREPPMPPQKTSENDLISSGLRRRGATSAFPKDSASHGVTYLEIPGGFHDLLHDTETPICLSNIKAWLKEVVGL